MHKDHEVFPLNLLPFTFCPSGFPGRFLSAVLPRERDDPFILQLFQAYFFQFVIQGESERKEGMGNP